MIKKLFLSWLVVSLLIMFLVGPCFAVEISWQLWGRPDEIDAFNKLISNFEAINPDIQVKLEEYSWDDHHKTLDVRLAGGKSPDIYRTIYPFAGRYIDAGHATELSTYFPKDYWERFWPTLTMFVEREGKYYAIPQMTDTNVVFFNADAFKLAGLSAPTSIEEAWTWDDWEKIGRTIKEKTSLPYGIAGAQYDGGPWYINTWGGGFCTPDGTRPDVNKPEVIQGLKLQKKWLDEELEPRSTLFMRADSHEQMFAMGKIGVIWSGIWSHGWMAEQIGNAFEMGVTFCPRGPAGFSTHLGGCVNIISPQSKHKEEAAKFLEFLNNDQSMEEFCQVGFIPSSVVVANRITYEDPQVDKMMKIAIEQYSQIPEIIPIQYQLKNYAAMQEAVIENIGPGLLGDISVEEAVANLEKELERLLIE